MRLRTGKSGRYRYYTCSRQAIQGKTGCKGRSIPMARLDGLVLEHMSERLFAPERLRHLLKEYLDRSVGAQAGRRERLRQLKVERLAAFGNALRQQLANGDVQFRKAYLNLFIDRVEVDDAEVRICGPKAALARAASGGLPKPSDGVPSFVREWRPRGDSNTRPTV